MKTIILLLLTAFNSLAASVTIPISSEPIAAVVFTNDDLLINATNNGTGTWTTKRATVGTVIEGSLPLFLPVITNAAGAVVALASNALSLSIVAATNPIPQLISNQVPTMISNAAAALLPFPISPPVNLIFEGDSLTQEAGTGTDSPHTPPYSTYPLYLRGIWTGYVSSWHNYAIGGNMLADVTNRLATVLANLPAGSNNLMLLDIGANDFIPNGPQAITNAAVWLKTWQTYCSNVQSAGIKLAVFTVEDRYRPDSAPYEAFRAAINQGIRAASCKDFLIDADLANPSMNPTNNLRTYDGTHANTNGALWQAQFAANSIGLAASIGPKTNAVATATTGATVNLTLSGINCIFVNGLLTSATNAAGDSDYTNFVARANITDSTELSAVGNLISAAKAHGWWANCDAIYPFIGGTSNSCAQNLCSTNYTVAWSASNVWFTNGVIGDGASGFGDTGFNPSLTNTHLYQSANAHLFIYVGTTNAQTSTAAWIGAGTGSSLSPGALVYAGNLGGGARINALLGDGMGATYYAGAVIGSRTNGTAGFGADYLDKAQHDADNPTYYTLSDPVAGALPNTTLTLLAAQAVGGTKYWPCTGPLIGASIGASIPIDQWQLMRADWKAFETALGRNP